MNTKSFPEKLNGVLYKKIYPLFKGVNEIIYIRQLKHFNIGDHLIYLGEKKFFKDNNIKIIKEFDDRRFLERRFRKVIFNKTIVIRGGGYFGDIWYNSYLTTESVVKDYKKNNIIIMPQSLFFKDKKLLEKSKKIFKGHNNVTIIMRDKKSYNLAKKYFNKNKIIFAPDSAFFLANSIKESKSIHLFNKFYKKKFLYVDRNDKEKNLGGEKLNKTNTVFFDWANTSDIIFFDIFSLIKLNSSRLLKKASELFNAKELIITSRLHGAILASLLRKKYVLLSNNYHKIESFYNSWLKKDPLCKLVKSEEALENYLKNF